MMADFRAILALICLISVTHEIQGQSDLRSALAAIDRRQKELADYEDRYGFKPFDQQDNIEFLNNAAEDQGYYGDYYDDDSYGSMNKRITSSFRERMEEDQERQMEEFARNLYHNLENNGMPGDINKNYLRELWERYYGNDINYANDVMSKRYRPFGIKSVSTRKRDRYFLDTDDDPSYSIHHHVPRNGDYLQLIPQNQVHSYDTRRKFILKKRSSSSKDEEAKGSIKKQTDPKVEKDLSSIFNREHKPITTNIKTTTMNPEKKMSVKKDKKNEKKDKPIKSADINKEIFEPVTPQKKTVHLKKKSIDWSEYFGIDKRNSEPKDNDLDQEWLMERYHKAIALSAKKRNADFPFRVTDDKFQSLRKVPSHINSEKQIDDIQKELERIEEKIVGDTLKYTGANQDEDDDKVLEVKDNIISNLAQAYNIEKMRNALEEYKIEIAKAQEEVEKSKNDKSSTHTEEKRLTVPRKQAVDDTIESSEVDNNIKCTNSEDCHEQNFKIPQDILNEHYSTVNGCSSIQKACNDVSSFVGHYGHVFEAACNIHQMCLLCDINSSWFPPTRQCNMLFITKASELCLGKEECKREARASLKYLLDINKSLRVQIAATDECELQCPDADLFRN